MLRNEGMEAVLFRERELNLNEKIPTSPKSLKSKTKVSRNSYPVQCNIA